MIPNMQHLPEDVDQELVQTPYGKGLVVRTRHQTKKNECTMREIELLDWVKPASKTQHKVNKPSMLYSPTKFPSIEPTVGCEVSTQFGRGTVVEIRHNANDKSINSVVVRISSWRLAGRSSVTCYLSREAVQVVRPKKIYEMSVYEKVELAQSLKDKAADEFSHKQYQKALQLYAEAVDAVRYVQHQKDSTIEVRADLLLVMITCCNNAATCCVQLQEWDRAQKFAKNGLVLLDALLEKQGSSKILNLLNREGHCNSKLFGAWRAKSLLLIARSLAERHETEEAIQNLQLTLDTVATYKKEGDPMFRQLQGQEKEVQKLLAACKQRLKAERKKERQRAKAMFGGGADTTKSEEKKTDDIKQVEEKPASVPPAPTRESYARDTAGLPISSPTPLNNINNNNNNNNNDREPLKSSLLQPKASLVSNENPDEPNENSGNHRTTKKRVSFADGSIPGTVEDEVSFLDEHKEALLILGGILLGSMCIQLFSRMRR